MLNNIDVSNGNQSFNIRMLTKIAARYMRGVAVLFLVLGLVLSNSDAFAVNSSSSTDAAVVVVDSDNLTGAETATVDLLIGYGKDPMVIDSDDADYNTLQAYDFVAASEDGALTAAVINELITNGKMVWLIHSAGSPLGGQWSSSTSGWVRNFQVEQNQLFLDGYRSSISFTVQASGAAWYIGSDYPAGWTILGKNTYSFADRQTMLYREHASGGKGLIYTYDPSRISETGKNLYDLMYEWLEGVPAHEGKTVPEGHVAFVISQYDDSANPDLTTEETALYSKLLGYGYDVTFVRFSRLKHSDLSGAAMVAAATYPSLDAGSIGEYLSSGINVLMVHTAASTLGGRWSSDTSGWTRNLELQHNQVFLDGYRSDMSFAVQASGAAWYIGSDFPAGWTILGKNSYSFSDRQTLLYREHGSGGKGLIYTYDPSQTSETGKNVYDLMYEWLEGVPPHEGKTVPEGHVAFVICQYDDSANPDLTTEETALYSKLLGYGYDVTFVRFSRLKHSDLSQAKIVAAATYPSLDAGSIGEYLLSGINVLMVHTAASTLGGQWSSNTSGSYLDLFVIKNEKFLSAYENEEVIRVQSGGRAFYMSSDYPEGWEALGRNSYTFSPRKTAFSYNGADGKGAIFTYQPAELSTEGDEVLADIVTWLLQEPTSASPPAAELPDDFELRQNYPNPFNPVTTISYALPVEQNVTLEVFNIQGQRVTTLVNERQKAGWHEIPFDASRLASGVYIYRIQTGSFVEIKKMMLMK